MHNSCQSILSIHYLRSTDNQQSCHRSTLTASNSMYNQFRKKIEFREIIRPTAVNRGPCIIRIYYFNLVSRCRFAGKLFIHLIDLHQHPVGGENILGKLPSVCRTGFRPCPAGAYRHCLPAGHRWFHRPAIYNTASAAVGPFSRKLLLFSPGSYRRKYNRPAGNRWKWHPADCPGWSHAIREIRFLHIFVKMFQNISGGIFFAGIDQSSECHLGMCHPDGIQVTTVFFIIIYTRFICISVSKFFHDGIVGGVVVHTGPIYFQTAPAGKKDR